jgi:probable F420-dependent oxidoreductase
MELGLSLPQIGDLATPDAVVHVARGAESIGFDSLWVMDRLLRPIQPRDPYPGTPDLSWPQSFASCLDPLETLTFAAAHTRRVTLGTSTLNVPWYRPLTLARRLATLDVLSNGRLRVGIGLGWSQDEFEALGLSTRGLGRRLDDQLDALEAIWADGQVCFDGDGYRIAPSEIGPKPVGGARPPLYLGGFTDASLRRVARRGDGWLTVFLPRDLVAANFARVQQLATEARRDPDAIRLVVRANPTVSDIRVPDRSSPFHGTIEQIADEIKRYADIGTHEMHIDLQFSPGLSSASELLDTAARIHDRVGSTHGQRPPTLVGAAAPENR